MISLVSAKGQLVIPSAFRKRYGIKPRSKIEWIETIKGIFILPLKEDAVASSRGILKKTSTSHLLRNRKEDIDIEGRTKK